MIVAPISPEVRLLAGVASMLIPLLEKVGLRIILATVVAGTTEDPIAPANPIPEVVELVAFSAAVMT